MRILEIIREERKKTAMLLVNFRKIAEKYPQKQLYERRMNGEKRYYYKIEGDTKRYYIGWKQPELLRGLLEKKNALEKIPLLEENLKKLDALLDGYHSHEEIFPVQPMPPELQPGERRKSYPPSENTAYRSELKHDTGLGFYTNSKSEAIIALRYHAFGVPFQYEKKLRLLGADGRWKNMYPDYTVFGTEEEVYHEHFGLYHKPGYRETQKGRLADYHAADILLGRDLFVTMDGPNEDLDVAAIDRFIIHTILPLCTGADDSGIENDF